MTDQRDYSKMTDVELDRYIEQYEGELKSFHTERIRRDRSIIDVSADLSSESDSRIQSTIDRWNDEIKEYEHYITTTRRHIAEFQQVLDRRALNAFWAANPHLLRLEVGDKLLVTTALFAYRQRFGGWPKREEDRLLHRDECEVVSIFIDDQGVWCAIDIHGDQTGNIPMDVIQHMRRAYLEKQQVQP